MAAIMNRYPAWKYIVIVAVLVFAFIYALPNIYGEYPAVQIMGTSTTAVDETTVKATVQLLEASGIRVRDSRFENQRVLVRFYSTDDQLKAKDILQKALGDNALVALNLSPATPAWMQRLGANPMKLGLDLRGGVHFLLQVDIDSVVKQRIEGDTRGIGQSLRDERIRYSGVQRGENNQLILLFRDAAEEDKALSFVSQHYNEFLWAKSDDQKKLSFNRHFVSASFISN